MELDSAAYYNKYQSDHAKKLLDKYLVGHQPSAAIASAQEDFGGKPSASAKDPYTYNGYDFVFAKASTAKVGKNEIAFIAGKEYTPFMVLGKLLFNLSYTSAALHVEIAIRKLSCPYIRVGVDYFKEILVTDRYGIDRKELKRWKKDEIKEDHTKDMLRNVLKYDSFVMEPDNVNYSQVVNGSYNTYSPFSHKPEAGDWTWTKELLTNVFGDQFELGLRYMQALYLSPKQALPILVLGSVERETGKTTFLNWISQLFGGNYTVINPEDIVSSFNSSYAQKNVIAIEETKDDRSTTVNKLKNLSTSKHVVVNEKYLSQYHVPFFGKFIITTNFPDRFLRVDEEEIRLWVRILRKPTTPKTNIEDALAKEIPAFLHYLTCMPAIDTSLSRMVFTAEEIKTEALDKVKAESRSEAHKDLDLHLSEYFDAHEEADTLELTLSDVKDMFFATNPRVGVSYLRKVIQSEMGLETTHKKYTPPHLSEAKTGRVYTFYRNIL